jgi:hypothetical protein
MVVSTKNSTLFWDMTQSRLVEYFWKNLTSVFRFDVSSVLNTQTICSSEKVSKFLEEITASIQRRQQLIFKTNFVTYFVLKLSYLFCE